MADLIPASPMPTVLRSEERFSRNAETDLVCRLLLEKKNVIDAERLGQPDRERHVGDVVTADQRLRRDIDRSARRDDALLYDETAPTVIYTLSLHDALPI